MDWEARLTRGARLERKRQLRSAPRPAPALSHPALRPPVHRPEPIDLETFRDDLPYREPSSPLATNAWTDFERPSLNPLARIIRANGDPQLYVVLARNSADGVHHELASFPADELENGLFANLERELWADGFVTPNGFFLPAKERDGVHRIAARSTHVPELPKANRQHLRTLSAVLVDVDCKNVGLSYGQALGAIEDMVEAGSLPQPSAYWRSGTGMWVLWLLRDRLEPHRAPPAHPKLVNFWKRIGRAAHGKLVAVGADIGPSINPKTFIRVPGSTNHKSGRRAQAHFSVDATGEPFLYTLDELASALGLPPLPLRTPAIERAVSKDPRNVLKGMRGAAGRAHRALLQFDYLREQRVGFSEGVRGNALDLYARLLNQLRFTARKVDASGTFDASDPLAQFAAMTDAEWMAEMRGLASTFDPPMDRPRLNAQLKYQLQKKCRGLGKNRDIANRLRVTADEHADLRDHFAGPGTGEVFPVAAEFSEQLVRPPIAGPHLDANQRRLLRQQLIRAFVNAARVRNEFPSYRALAAQLLEHGIAAAPATIGADLRALGLLPPRSAEARELRLGTPLPFHADGPT